MNAQKKTSASKKATAGKKASKKKASTTRKAAAKKPASKKPSAAKPAPAKKAPAKPKKGTVSVESVNLGHLFALRPRVNTSFPPAEFLKAKRALADERYASIEQAARAVAEKALSDVNRKPAKHSIGRR